MQKKNKLFTLAIAAAALTACDTSTGPIDLDSFNAEAALEDYRAMDAIKDSDGWRGFLAMGKSVSLQTFAPPLGVALMSARDLSDLREADGARAYATELIKLSRESLHAAGAPIISTPNRGKTLIYDDAIGDYRIDETRTGAPANGVRIIIYKEDSAGNPNPAIEIGYADLIDNGDNSAEDISLRLVAVEGSLTVLDYAFTLDENGGKGAASVSGFLQDDTNKLDFSIDLTGSEGPDAEAFDADFRMAVASRNFEIRGSVKHSMQGARETADVDLTVTHGSESLSVDVSGTETTIDGVIRLNGDVFVNITGNPDDPTITKPEGELTQADILVLHRVLDVVEDVFDFLEDLMDPVDEIVLLAAVL